MRGLAISGAMVLAVVVLFLAGMFGQLPGLMLAGFCLGPVAFIALGFALGRAGLRIALQRDDAPATPYRSQRQTRRGFAAEVDQF